MIAAAMAGTDDTAYLLLRYYWCQDEDVYPELFSAVADIVEKMACSEGWNRFKSTDKQRRLTKAALKYHHHKDLCRSCDGTGVNKIEECSTCGGAGLKHMTPARLAEEIGVSRSSWLRGWDMKLSAVLAEICALEEEGLEKVSLALA